MCIGVIERQTMCIGVRERNSDNVYWCKRERRQCVLV